MQLNTLATPSVLGTENTLVTTPASSDVGSTTDVVLRTIVEARGNHKLALDILHHTYNLDLTINDIVDLMQDHLQELKAQMEVVATLELFSLMPQLHKTLVENLSNLEGSDAVQAYMKLMDLIIKQTSSNDINVNINDMRWKLVPRDLQQKYAALEAAGMLDKVIEGTYEEVA